MNDAARWRRALAWLALLSASAFAGCSGGASFHADAPTWKAGYGWEYDQHTVGTSQLSGKAFPGFEDQLGPDYEETNETYRLEVFNSTAASVEGTPIYALAALRRSPPDPQNGTEASPAATGDVWEALVYSLDLNPVEPAYLDWRTQEIQLTGEPGNREEPDGASNATSNRSGSSLSGESTEHRRLDFPLTKGKSWRHAENVPLLDVNGIFEARTVKSGKVRVPGGNFTAIEIKGTLAPIDVSDIETGIRQLLESQGGSVASLTFRFSVSYDYWYADAAANLVDAQETGRLDFKARGKDADGDAYDFAYVQTSVTTSKLKKFQLLETVEKPLTFGVDVERGLYAPKPLTPASQLAVEILSEKDGLNTAEASNVRLGVRIYNSTGGEKTLRGPDASYPAVVNVAQFKPDYDKEHLEIVWSLQAAGPGGYAEFRRTTGDELTLTAKDLGAAGLKQIEASLKEKDTPQGPGAVVYTDTVLFEAYFHGNVSATRAPTNLTQNSIQVRFPVDLLGQRVTVTARTDTPGADSSCPPPDCLIILDARNRRPPDERQERMRFETTRVPQFTPGPWTASFSPTVPGQTIQFEIEVRYRAGY